MIVWGMGIRIMKKWYKSKTILVALLQAIAGILIAFQAEYPSIGLIVIGKSLIDITIRYLTQEAIEK